MLKEKDIMDDWSVVKRALSQRKKTAIKNKPSKCIITISICILIYFFINIFPVDPRMIKPYNSCRFIDNKLLYNGKWFQKGQGIVIDNKDQTDTT